MAETRKHNQQVRDDLDRALLAALGEQVRPFTPGSDPFAPQGDVAASTDEEPRPGVVPPAAPLGAFTFGAPATPRAGDRQGSPPDA